jgi:cell division protein FtsW
MNIFDSRLQARRRMARDGQGGAQRRHRPDYMLLVIMSALLVIGAVVVYAIGPGLTNNKNLPENYFSSKQLTAIALGIAGFVVASRVSLEHWKKYQWPIILFAGFVAVAVRFVGEEINGAHRWIQVGGFSFQAAELVKLAIVLWVAHYLARKKLEGKMQSFDVLKPLAAPETASGRPPVPI